MRATILAESRRGTKTALIERVEGELDDAYRVTVCRRYPTLPKAREAFLSEVSPKARERFEGIIDKSNAHHGKP